MNQDKVEKAQEEVHDQLMGFRRRRGESITSVQTWRVMAETAEQNWRDTAGSGDEDYWAMVMAVCRRRAESESQVVDLTERRFS